MKEISLHLLDIVENSISAGASHVDIFFDLSESGTLRMTVRDDGKGMEPELLKAVRNPLIRKKDRLRLALLCLAPVWGAAIWEKIGGRKSCRVRH